MKTRIPGWEGVLFLLLVLLFFGAQLHLLVMGQTLVWDEPAYLGNARALIGESHYTEGFRAPLVSVMTASLWLVTGESLFAARLMIILCATTAVILTYYLTRRRTRYGLFIAALVATNAQFFFWSGFAYAEIPSLLLTLLGIWALEREDNVGAALAGAGFALAFLGRFSYCLTLIVVFIWMLSNKQTRHALLLCVGAAPVLGAWVVRNIVLHATPFWDLLLQMRVIAAYTWQQPIGPFLIAFLASDVALLAIIIGVLIIGFDKKRIGDGWQWAICVLAYLALHLFVIQLKLDRYLLAMLPFLALFAASMLGAARLRMKRWVPLIIIGVLLLASAPPLAETISLRSWKMTCAQDDAVLHASERLTAMMVADGHGDGRIADRSPVTIVSDAWPLYGWYNNVRAYSLYTTNWTEIYQNVTPQYVIHNSELGGYDREVLRQEQAAGRLVHAGTISGACDTVELWRVDYRRVLETMRLDWGIDRITTIG